MVPGYKCHERLAVHKDPCLGAKLQNLIIKVPRLFEIV